MESDETTVEKQEDPGPADLDNGKPNDSSDPIPEPKNDDNTKQDTDVPTFKTPSFVIASKKKVKSGADDVFKTPPPSVPKSEDKTSEKATSDADKDKQKQPIDNDVKESMPVENNKSEEKFVAKSIKPQKYLSPAEQLKTTQTAVPYKEPSWSSTCDDKYSFEVIKNGAVIDTVDLTSRCFHVVGRLPSCNIPMEHPSLSRHHAVIQYSDGENEEFPKGWYLFDLDSTHGTWINKNKVPPKKFHRLHVDYVLKFGGSTRLFILQGPGADREEESELSASEMKEQREKQKKEAELIRQAEIKEAELKVELLKKREEQKGCSWGIDEDEANEEEDENAENPFAAIEPENEALYINDPKKALNGYFEREGLDLPEYEFVEAGFGKWKCTIELPIDTASGEPVVAEAIVSGKRKEAVIACALEACRILDRHGELRKAAQESRKRKQRNWEDDDFYDSDEDTYLDRTGAIEKKRELRKMKVGKTDKATETYDTLVEKHNEVLKQIKDIEAQLEHAKAQAAAMEADDVDALDAYMSAIKSGMMDTKTKMKLKRQLMELKSEEQKVRKLVNIAKPASLPELKPAPVTEVKKPSLASGIGKIKGHQTGKLIRPVTPKQNSVARKEEVDDEVEEDEVENEDTDVRADNERDKKSDNDTNADSEKVKVVKDNVTTQETKIDIRKEENDHKASNKGTKDIRKDTKQTNEPKKQESRSHMKGPTLPLAAVLEKLQEEADNAADDDSDSVGEGKGRKRKGESGGKGGKKAKSGTGYKDDDPDYAVWLPPQNQSGDGRTHLNEKLGY